MTAADTPEPIRAIGLVESALVESRLAETGLVESGLVKWDIGEPWRTCDERIVPGT
jgi:hypothetical protein